MKFVRLTEIAYNTPCVVAIDISKGYRRSARVIKHSNLGAIGVGVVETFIVTAMYDGELVELGISGFVYRMVTEAAEHLTENLSMLYLFVHAKGGAYSGCSRLEYFKNFVCYDFISKERYLQLSKYYGFKVFLGWHEDDSADIAIFKNYLNSLFMLRVEEEDKDKLAFSYADIINILEMSKIGKE